MIYEHYCQGCDTVTEDICKMDDRKQFIVCKECGGSAERFISARQGIQDSDPTWLPAAVESAVALGETNVPSNRQDYNKYLKNNGITCVS